MSAVEKVSFFERTQEVQVLNTIKQRRSVGHVSQQQPSREAIERHNAAVRGYDHDDATRQGILSACGMADAASAPRDGVSLNNLDDWYEFHQAVLK